MLSFEDLQKIELRIMAHEGYRPHPYTDPAGNLTIGFGRNLSSTGIDRVEATWLLRTDIRHAILELQHYQWWEALSAPRQAALIDVMVNIGATRFAGFHKMLEYLRLNQFGQAAGELLDSEWRIQVGMRGEHDAEMLASGEWPKSA